MCANGGVCETAGACTQVEGYTTADGRGPSIWDTFSARSGTTFKGETGASLLRSCLLR